MVTLKIPNFKKFFPQYHNLPTVNRIDVENVMDFLNIKIPYDMEQNQFGWDGKKLHLGGIEHLGGIVHEICHWIVAPSSRKKLPDFGLGSGFNSKGKAKRIVSKKYSYTEEYFVCLLEYIILFNLNEIEQMEHSMKSAFFDDSDMEELNANVKKIKTLSNNKNILNLYDKLTVRCRFL